MRTSPALGGITSISSIERGSLTAQATAALHLMISVMGLTSRLGLFWRVTL